jgi:integrase
MVTVLRFFFKVTLDRPETTGHLVFVYEPRKLPRVLSPEEVLRLLEAAPAQARGGGQRSYGAGLRAMEVVALKVSDIDSKRMMLRVEQGFFGQNRTDAPWSGRCANRLGVALKPNCRQRQLLHALTQCSNPPCQVLHHDHCSWLLQSFPNEPASGQRAALHGT